MKATEEQLEQFVRGYLFAAVWAEEESLEEYGMADSCDVHEASKKKAKEDCEAFIEEHYDTLKEIGEEMLYSEEYPQWEILGHDFYFTRNEHGVGYWSRDFNREETLELAKQLSDQVGYFTKYPPVTVYLGDDGFIYID